MAFAPTVTACSSGDGTKSTGKSETASLVSETVKDPNALTLPLGQVVNIPQGGAGVESGQKRVVNLPGPNGGVLTVGTSQLTLGTMPGVTADDNKSRTAPVGGALLDFSIAENDLLPPIGTSNPDGAAYTKPITISVEDASGKSTSLATVKASAIDNHWLASVPKDAKTLTISTDGGKQIITLSNGQRDDNNSNGLPLERTLTAPVTSASTCDAAPTPTGQVGTSLTVSEPMACTVNWHAVDHYEGIGWAPKGKVLLIATVTPSTPQLTFTKGDGFLNEQSYSRVEHVSVTATLDGKTANVISGDNSDSWGKRKFIVATPISATEKPTKLAIKITWTSNAFGSQMTGFPSKVTGTLPATVSSLDSTTTIKTGTTPN